MRRRISIAILLALAGCATPVPLYVAHWQQIDLGMTRAEVRALLGEPHEVTGALPEVPMPEIKVASTNDRVDVGPAFANVLLRSMSDRSSERWSYECGSALFGPSQYAFVVYFDREGKVMRFRRPTTGPYRDLPKEDPSVHAGAE